MWTLDQPQPLTITLIPLSVHTALAKRSGIRSVNGKTTLKLKTHLCWMIINAHHVTGCPSLFQSSRPYAPVAHSTMGCPKTIPGWGAIGGWVGTWLNSSGAVDKYLGNQPGIHPQRIIWANPKMVHVCFHLWCCSLKNGVQKSSWNVSHFASILDFPSEIHLC